jgi:hypothetical protein
MDGKFYVVGKMIINIESPTSGKEFSLETRTWRRIPYMFSRANAIDHALSLPITIGKVMTKLLT